MTTRKSYNQAQAEWVARIRAARPELAALWAQESTGSPESETGIYQRAFGRVPQGEAEKYAADEALDSQPCLKGRGED